MQGGMELAPPGAAQGVLGTPAALAWLNWDCRVHSLAPTLCCGYYKSLPFRGHPPLNYENLILLIPRTAPCSIDPCTDNPE